MRTLERLPLAQACEGTLRRNGRADVGAERSTPLTNRTVLRTSAGVGALRRRARTGAARQCRPLLRRAISLSVELRQDAAARPGAARQRGEALGQGRLDPA